MAFDILNPTVIEGALRRCWRNAGTPTDGTSGTYAGSADPGDILIDTTNTKLYVNTNTAASPTWSQIVTAGVAFSGDLEITGDITLATEDVSVAQGHLVYLDGQDGGEYIISDAANELTIRATTTLNLAIGSNDEVSISSIAVTLATNALILSAGAIAVAQGYSVYLDGNGGGEFLISDAANELTLNATTTLNLAIGGSDIISIAAATVTLNKDLAVAAGEFVSGAPVKQLITDKSGGQTLTAAESGVIRVTTDDVYIYLPTYLGNTGLTYTIKAAAAYSAGVHVRGNGTELIDAKNIQTSAAVNDFISIIATAANGWNSIGKFGTWVGTN